MTPSGENLKKDVLSGKLEEALGPSAKIWTAYISEAEKHDKAFAQDCQRDMDAILIFAGLFSACLTAFIIESYKNLRPDPNEAAVLVLIQILQQLPNASHSTLSYPAPPSATSYSPPTSALVCNFLWFLSLGFSLASALTATLSEQWARAYLKATESRSAPSERARIRAYLFQGLERFGMKAVVDAVPMFLHASLSLFFAGLVAFFLPVNILLATLVSAILMVSLVLYTAWTLLPVVYSDCPYRTPISNWCWKGLNALRRHRFPSYLLRNDYKPPILATNMMHEVELHAIRLASRRGECDNIILSFTVQSLDSRDQLLQFISTHNLSNAVDRRQITAMLMHTDLSSRLIHRLQKLDKIHSGEKARDVPSILRAISFTGDVWTSNISRGLTGYIHFDAAALAALCTLDVEDESTMILRCGAIAKVLWPLFSELGVLSTEIQGYLSGLFHDTRAGRASVNTHLHNRGFNERMEVMERELAVGWDHLKSGRLDSLSSSYPTIIPHMEEIWPLYMSTLRLTQSIPTCSQPVLFSIYVKAALEQCQTLSASLRKAQFFLRYFKQFPGSLPQGHSSHPSSFV
ncbi:hypothetical protein Hypma_005914 [Hypsizygus marmoreus]|uniref:DUF6535 domain-containing protein n=1 Tax=Hypsizygus marmoreus TaxID=39966 RepID=A0A369KB83_HYPMA|nr:hypothetical protein Hypma_005914 [Hypsizygus marmoreus]